MRESYWGYWIIVLGVFVVMILMLISNVTTTNTQDYYLIKEVSEESMIDAVDLGYYRISGELRINADKFVESFIRRFSNSVELNTYTFDFYGIYEAPPKVSVKVTTKSDSYVIGTSSESFDIVNKIDAILELDGVVTGEGNSDIQPDDKDDDVDESSSEYDPTKRRIPTHEQITDFRIAHKDVFYECSDPYCFREKLKDNMTDTLISMWQSYYHVTFTEVEKRQFIAVANE